ncbi:uncharacterized protein [Dermacentor albipictus]|uniref:uncharacterized protein isoform X2 n=1 Tax=Dermacentor albipictus TaxID=60249 RepID=UPI0038FC210B
MFKRCLFFVQLFTGLAAFPECTTKAFLDASPLACHHALMFPHARDDCPISALEDSHGLFTAGFDKILTSAIGDVSLDGALMRVTTPAPFSIKATPQLHRFSGQGSSNTGQMFKRCLFFVQIRLSDTPGGHGGRSASPRIYRKLEDHFQNLVSAQFYTRI